MDDCKRKKKTFDFVEGHKRETRKSYQSFIEETDKGKETYFPEWHHPAKVKMEDVSDECVRKSSRTPVPKKTFDLVDSFDEDKWKTKNSTNTKKSTQFDPSKLREMVEVKREPSDDTDSDTSAPRKSSRTPVPKKSFDLIDSGIKSFPNQNQNLLATEPIAEVPKQKKSKQSGQVEKSPAITSAKSSKKRRPSKDETPERKTEPKKQSSSKKDMSKLKVKVDFKSKKGKTNRKRKVENEPGPASLPHACIEQDELSQKKRNFEENIDQSILMEALQALKQESYDYPAAKRAKPAQSEEASEVVKSFNSSERNYGSRKKPPNLELDFDHGNVHVPKLDQIKPEGDLHPNNPNDEANIGKSAKDFSSSTTERPDGHIILKVGGLASPSKIKKHKKKHKHHHHDAEPENDGMQNFPMEETDALLKSQQYLNDVVIKTEPNESDAFQLPSETLQECYSTDWQNETTTEKKKKHRSHKKKKKSLSSVNDEPKEVTVESKDDFIVKKRKIYKKKKGEKILVRIQTEFWDKNGALVKVEPSEIKEPGNLPQTKAKKAQKNDLSKANVIIPKVKNKGLGHNEKVSQKPLAVDPKDSVLKVVQDSGQLDVVSKKKKKPAKQKQTPRSDGKKKTKDSEGDAQSLASPVKKKKKERKTQTLTAYLLYCRKYRQKVVTENPEMGKFIFATTFEI